VALASALNKLAELDAELSLRFFGAFRSGETAVVMEISPATVKREWATARAWLKRGIAKGAGG
jgi:DNA-directed RNA polymerase specialized sigma24 family protein